ncbi:MAG TPA: type II toxin-antitoxin system HicB family antitoxin [Desulfonatronum sp.]|nr:type II toxin-antitoxin system HicB family antitoxin [Desulfonatronum sp.]
MEATLQYWTDGGWYVGKLKEVPGVFSQGETLDDLIENIRDAYQLIVEDEVLETQAEHKEIAVAL